MPPSLHHSNIALFPRSDDPAQAAEENKKLTPTLIIGIVVAAALFVAGCIWLLVRYVRKQQSSKREEDRGAAFLNVRGVVKDGEKSGLGMKGDLFSRDKLTDSVIMPEKTLLPPDASREEIIEHYTAEGKLPRPFAPFMTGGDGLKVPEPADKSENRNSTASWISMGRHSFLGSNRSSVRSSIASFAGSEADGDKRKVRQIFTPVLPDELVVSLGDRLTVVNSFDDGWCIVGRDSVFKPGEVELGAIPAWCFMKPVQGLHAERPMRTTSLGVTITLNAPAGPRDNILSWSNF